MAASEKGRIDRGEDESSDQLHYEANSDRPLAYIVNFLPDPTFVIDKEELLNHHPSQTTPERQPDGSLSFEKAEEMMRMAFEKGTHRFEWVRRRKMVKSSR